MEKRFIIAIFLITIVVIISNEYLWKQPTSEMPVDHENSTEQRSTEEERVESSAQSVENNRSNIVDTLFSQPSLKKVIQDSIEIEKTVIVDTDLYRAEFSTRGAKLISWELKQHLDKRQKDGGKWLQLLPESNSGVLQTDFSNIGDFSHYNFDVSQNSLTLSEQDSMALIFSLKTPNWKFIKKFVFYKDEYQMGMDLIFDGIDPNQVGNYNIAWNSGLNVTEKNKKDDLNYFTAISLIDGKTEKEKLKDIIKKSGVSHGGSIKWAGLRTKYFTAFIKPSEMEASEVRMDAVKGQNIIGVELIGTYSSGYITNQSFTVYAGPIDYYTLKEIDPTLEQMVDLGGILKPISKLILNFFTWLYTIIPNYGIVIILFSIITKILFYPLGIKSFKSMRAMSNIQPKMNEIKEKYKDNPKKQQEEMMALYKEHGVSPVSGCLPMLPQMPIFFALFRVLRSTIELRGAYFIPYWLTDLSQPDPIRVLPILMGVAMFVQQKISPSTAAGVQNSQQKMMNVFMPIFMTILFLNFPAGLVLYWFVNNLLTIAQQYHISKSTKVA